MSLESYIVGGLVCACYFLVLSSGRIGVGSFGSLDEHIRDSQSLNSGVCEQIRQIGNHKSHVGRGKDFQVLRVGFPSVGFGVRIGYILAWLSLIYIFVVSVGIF